MTRSGFDWNWTPDDSRQRLEDDQSEVAELCTFLTEYMGSNPAIDSVSIRGGCVRVRVNDMFDDIDAEDLAVTLRRAKSRIRKTTGSTPRARVFLKCPAFLALTPVSGVLVFNHGIVYADLISTLAKNIKKARK